MMKTSKNARVHSLGSLKSQEVRSEDANMTSRGNSCVIPHTRAIAAHFCELSNGGGFSAVFGKLLPGQFRLHRSKFSCIVFPQTKLLNSCWKKSKRKLKIFVIVPL